ncbi:MAG: glycoside hydrolase family 20 protein [Bacteroides sp.]|nr:glycoside hydrolase family 20 protein [Bacteroides sp.]
MHKLNHIFLFVLVMTLISCQTEEKKANYQVIPLPQEVVLKEGNPFVLDKSTAITYPADNEAMQHNAEFLALYLQESTGEALRVQSSGTGKSDIVLKLDPQIESEEGYSLLVEADQVTISGKTEKGVFYGIQTLRKSIPAEAKHAKVILPAVQITDAPRFGYRGMHLDVSRHFFEVDFVKKYIDILALHNLNVFHWHLTDDQGWRIESKKYPRLTEIGSQRSRTVIGRNSSEYDETPYGGFYTQEEIKEVISYAADRFIEVIPEVDLPGHMLAVLACYPEFGCTGGPYEVCPRWGIFDDVLCIGNEDTMVFLEEIMDEVMDLFPSRYIHIGGDEAPRVRWKECSKCQARIQAENLKADSRHSAEDRLQSYCMQRIEKLINNRGRQMIGWDEILEGDIAPNAVVMSWRGLEGGIEAAQLGHDVIMVPTSYAYFDYYQTTDTEDEPLAIGGFVNVEKVYSLEPVPAVLTAEESKHILGAQANIWTEYIPSSNQIEYKLLPRLAALSEVQWTQPEKKNYRNFTQRLPQLMDIYEREGYNYAKHVFDLKTEFTPDKEKNAVKVELSTIDDSPIYYTLDGSEPTKNSLVYNGPIFITESADFRAVAIRPTGKSKVISEKIDFNLATSRPISLSRAPSERYTYEGAPMLVDGLRGTDSYASGRWLGFIGGDVEATIDMGAPVTMQKVTTQAIVDTNSWIMGCTGLVVSVSDDGKEFREIKSIDFPADTDITQKSVETYSIDFEPTTSQYIRIKVKRSPALPKGHSGEGKTPYLFMDEISVY